MRWRSEDYMQAALIGLAVLAALFFGVFFYREVFPEYRIYQNAYVDLEQFRSTYTGEPPPVFRFGVQQIVLPAPNNGPETIDRCISCHVALKFDHFSPTIVAKDINGKIIVDENGIPQQVPNPNYIWAKLDEKIKDLEAQNKPKEADHLKALKVAQVGDREYDMTKVLAMHPLMGRETRPFEYHPMEDYGCTVCHNGNGRGLTTEKAHGPVVDGHYEVEFEGHEPKFLEKDPENDPPFSKIFNHKPGYEILFQTTPLFMGKLIQANCVQCHQVAGQEIKSALGGVNLVTNRKAREMDSVNQGIENEKQALLALINNRATLLKLGSQKTLDQLQQQRQDYTRPQAELDAISNQIEFIRMAARGGEQQVVNQFDQQIVKILGSKLLAAELEQRLAKEGVNQQEELAKFLEEQRQKQKGNVQGTLLTKLAALDLEQELLNHIQTSQSPLNRTVNNEQVIAAIKTDVDLLTGSYKRGQELFISQACYACHRIAGYSRGGVGPELTREGLVYPWFVKQSIVWPQADLKSSTMPNTRMDHEEVEDILTYLLAQKGGSKVQSNVDRRIQLKAWDEGQKLWFEQALLPEQIQDVRHSMVIFTTQGCANCHRLKGFESNVGFAIEKTKPTYDALYEEREWFKKLFPEQILGSQIVEVLDKHGAEIDKRIVKDVRKNSIIEEIQANYPGVIESFYTNFKFAARAKNHAYQEEQLKAWHERLDRVLKMYIQEYGMGRIIGPRVNWSGVYRSDQWLMEHFWKPTAHVARSIMPVFPFDNTKFLALTHMLDVLGKQNRDEMQEQWQKRGFNPQIAFETHCAQCHGDFLQGNGPVSEWIYPIPKNLRNATFMRNYTKERVVNSIVHGVKGTPMPPWGEVATDKDTGPKPIPVLTQDQAQRLADWMFEGLVGSEVIRGEEDVPKWDYEPDDVIKELQNEGNIKKLQNPHSWVELLPKGEGLLAAIQPMPVPQKDEEAQITEIFDIRPYPNSLVDKKAYYIKKKYYTRENLAAGERFFTANCAVCHGKDADGAGNRAGSMIEAKPRMLINLDWLDTRDDLRLMRSIKFGVPGTSMTPWGDFTNALQRMQLVMYIRSLSADSENREKLMSRLYQAFFVSIQELEIARVANHSQLEAAQAAYDQLQTARDSRTLQEQKNMTADQLLQEHQKEIELETALARYQRIDRQLLDLQDLVVQERKLYESVGLSLLNQLDGDDLMQLFNQLIALNDGRFQAKNGTVTFNPINEQKFNALSQQISDAIQKQIAQLNQKKTFEQGKIATVALTEEVQNLTKEIGGLTKLTNQLTQLKADAARLREKQRQTVVNYTNQVKESKQ
jgi:mono/diheme cytochrome c family protein